MPQATPERSSPKRTAAAPDAFVKRLSVQFEQHLEGNQVEQEELPTWQPAAPRLRLFSPATPRPNSATPPPTRRNSLAANPPSSLSPTTRPTSAFCCKISLPSEHERLPTTSVTSPGAAPPATPVPSRASQILNKAHALQARTAAAAAHAPKLAFSAPGAAMPSGQQLMQADSPPGSPLMIVRSISRAPPRLSPQANGGTAAAAAATTSSPVRTPIGVDRSCRSSMPDPILRLTSSGSSVPIATTAMTTAMTTGMTTPRRNIVTSLSGDADAVATLAAGVTSSHHAFSPFVSSYRGGAEAHQEPPGGPKHVCPGGGGGGGIDGVMRTSGDLSGGGGTQSDGEAGTGGVVAGTDAARRLPAPLSGTSASSAVSEGSGDDSGSETLSRRGTATGDGATAITDVGSGGGGGGDGRGGGGSPAKFTRPSALATGAGRFVTSVSVPCQSAVHSPSSAFWPWPQDAPRRASQAAEGSPVNPGFLAFFNHVSQTNNSNYSNHPNHSSAPQHNLHLQLEPRSSTLGGGPIGPRVSSGYSSPARPGSSASVLLASRSLTSKSRPRSCSGTPASAAIAAATATNSTLGGIRAPAASSGGGFSGGGGGGGAVTAAAATLVSPSATYEILPDHHSRPAAAAATSVPLGSRVSLALAGILPLGNPGTFNLRMDERIDQVLKEGAPAVKTSGPKSPPPQAPNPGVIKMLHERHEAEAQRTLVDSAFSSGNPAAWMHQIMAESGSGTPPWVQAPKQPHQQLQAYRQLGASVSGSGSGSAAQSPRQNRPRQLQSPQPPSRQQGRPSPHQNNQHNHHNQHNQHSQHNQSHQQSVGSPRLGNIAGLTAAANQHNHHNHHYNNQQQHQQQHQQQQQQRLSTALGPGVPRHTSAETLHLQSMSYLASKEACRTLAADSRPAVSINLREVLWESAGSSSSTNSTNNIITNISSINKNINSNKEQQQHLD
ncbi:hypothetical protein Vafri_19652 [Volvox africanus]|uniref:Uncharacterized protein n=1 Tax=Volvox africanus TaxID=51714 RepID=A0A8J4BV75_9CHLO|nr:hypothetical protein Vafri_19652 [Volvox africanus]